MQQTQMAQDRAKKSWVFTIRGHYGHLWSFEEVISRNFFQETFSTLSPGLSSIGQWAMTALRCGSQVCRGAAAHVEAAHGRRLA